MAIAAVSIGLGIASIGLNAIDTVVKAGAQRRQAQLDAYFSEENARLADDAATDAVIRGAVESGYQRMRGSYEIGAMRAAMGASGVDGSTGSSVDAMATARMVNELEAQTVTANAAREARGYGMEATRFRQQAKMARKRGEADVFQTLLTGGADAAESSIRLGSSLYSDKGFSSSSPSPGSGRGPRSGGGQ